MIEKSGGYSKEAEIMQFDDDSSNADDNGNVDMEADDQGPKSAMKTPP